MSSPSSTVAVRPSTGSSPRKEQSPPRMQEYPDGAKNGKGARVRKFTLDWMGMDAPSEKHMRELFDYFDTDHSGFLNKSEIRSVIAESFENYGAPVDDRDLDRTFAKFDKDRSGKITFDEFCVLILSRLKM